MKLWLSRHHVASKYGSLDRRLPGSDDECVDQKHYKKKKLKKIKKSKRGYSASFVHFGLRFG